MGNPRLQLDIVGSDKTGRAFRSVRQEINTTSAALTKFTRGFGAAAGAFGLARFIGGVKGAVDELDILAKRARTVGLNTDFFQSLQLAAEEANVAPRLLESSLIALTKRLGELKAGTGPLQTGLQRVDGDLLNALRSASSTEQAFIFLAEATKAASSATDRARIANAAFGRSGVEIARILSLGRSGLEATAQKARELGLIMDEQLLANAERISNEFGVATRVLDVQFKQAVVNLAPAMTRSIQGINDFIRSTKRAIAIWRFFGAALDETTEKSEKAIETINRSAKSDLRPFVDPPVPKLNPLRDLTNTFELVRDKSDATLDDVKAKFDDVGATGVDAFSRVGDAAETALRRLRLTGNEVLDELLGKFGSLALQQFLQPSGKAISGGGGLPSSSIAAPFSITDLFSFGGFRASGGRVSPGRAFMVGERGREVFVPDQPGQVFPNGAVGGMSISVNVIDNAGVDISASTDRGLDGQQIINLVVNSRQFGSAVDRQINRGTSAGLRR